MNENLALPGRLDIFKHNSSSLQHYQLGHQELMQSIYSNGGFMFRDMNTGQITDFGRSGQKYFTNPSTQTVPLAPTR